MTNDELSSDDDRNTIQENLDHESGPLREDPQAQAVEAVGSNVMHRTATIDELLSEAGNVKVSKERMTRIEQDFWMRNDASKGETPGMLLTHICHPKEWLTAALGKDLKGQMFNSGIV